jgi:hypothetical protein
MTDNSNRSDPAKKVYTLPLSEKEIEKELSLIFDSHLVSDHSFKSSSETVRTSIDDFPEYLRNRVSGIAIPIVGGKLRS